MRKTRTTSTRRATRRTTRAKKSNPIWLFDIAGVALIFLCPLTLYALSRVESSAFFGKFVAVALNVTVGGVGSYVLALLFGLAGVLLIAGPLRVIPRNVSIGSVTLFLVIITWASRAKWAIAVDDPTAGGGLIGNTLAHALNSFAGKASYGFLTLFGVIALVAIADVPLYVLVDKLRSGWLAWKDAGAERARIARSRSVDKAAGKPGKVKINGREVEDEGRKRTLASIFGRTDRAEEIALARAGAVAEPAKPPVRISAPGMTKPERAPKNGEPQPTPVLALAPAEQGEFQLPPTSLLVEAPPPPPRVESELKSNIEIIERTLDEFKVTANVVEIACGPTVARYEIRLAPGIKVNKIVGLADNLAMQLAAIDVRVEAPIPGKAAIGVEVPNRNRATVVLREIVESKAFRDAPGKLTFALGKDVAGHPKVADLARMPHMLVGGATNAGKSIGLSCLISSLLFRATPDELKLVLIDPKRVELSMFDGIPHLACPVVKDVKQAAGIFRAVVQEMERRYEVFSRSGTRNLQGYNEKVSTQERLPFMVVVVDELADLMMQCAAEVEGSITRIAQLARATGIHLVIATQRPSVDVITGIIKANISSRMAFAVSSHHDSRTILDQKGAERLIGRGDMLFLPIDASKPLRIQGCFISDKEIDNLCGFLKAQRSPSYTLQPVSGTGGSGTSGGGGDDESDGFSDEFYEPSLRLIVNTGYCSTSMLQRKFKIGYTRAARIVDIMEQQGIVGPLDGAKPRQVLITKAQIEQMFGGPIGMRQDYPDDDYDEDVPPAEIVMPGEEEEDWQK